MKFIDKKFIVRINMHTLTRAEMDANRTAERKVGMKETQISMHNS